MRAQLTSRCLKLSTVGWPQPQIDAIQFAERVVDMDDIEGPLLAVYARGAIFDSPMAEQLIADGKAVEVDE